MRAAHGGMWIVFHTGNYESEGHALTRATLPPQSERAGLQPCHQKPRPQDASAVPKAGVERNARNDSICSFLSGATRGAEHCSPIPGVSDPHPLPDSRHSKYSERRLDLSN